MIYNLSNNVKHLPIKTVEDPFYYLDNGKVRYSWFSHVNIDKEELAKLFPDEPKYVMDYIFDLLSYNDLSKYLELPIANKNYLATIPNRVFYKVRRIPYKVVRPVAPKPTQYPIYLVYAKRDPKYLPTKKVSYLDVDHREVHLDDIILNEVIVGIQSIEKIAESTHNLAIPFYQSIGIDVPNFDDPQFAIHKSALVNRLENHILYSMNFQEAHTDWVCRLLEQSWKGGEERSYIEKTHPHLITDVDSIDLNKMIGHLIPFYLAYQERMSMVKHNGFPYRFNDSSTSIEQMFEVLLNNEYTKPILS